MPVLKYEPQYECVPDMGLHMESFESAGGDEDHTDENDVLLKRDTSLREVKDKSKNRKVNLLPRLRNGKNVGQRLPIHRRARRISRMFFCMLLWPLLLFLFYLNLYNNAALRRVPLAEWGYNTTRNVANYVLPNADTVLLEPRSICGEKLFLLIVVSSSVDNFAARQNIRETWGNTSEFNYHQFAQLHSHMKGHYLEPTQQRIEFYRDYIKTNDTFSSNLNLTEPTTTIPVRIVFLIGRRKNEALLGNETLSRLRIESEKYNDIVQQNFIDTYNNLTIKSVMMLKWVMQRCQNTVAFVMKCDDDTFVNIPNLLHYLLGGTVPLYNDTVNWHNQQSVLVMSNRNRLCLTSDLLTGYLFCGVAPVSDVGNKWYMPYYMFPEDIYPNYLSGSSYVMSGDVVPRLYNAALNTSLVYLEDVFITGICADLIHLRRTHNPLFSFGHSKAKCSIKGSITQHYIKHDAMQEMYEFVRNKSVICKPPAKYFKNFRLNRSNCT